MQILHTHNPCNEYLQQPRTVVVLKASVGGAVMLRRFFEGLPADLSIAFMLIMPMADEFSQHFSERLSAISGLNVKRPVVGDRLVDNQCWLFSENDCISLSNEGVLDCISLNSSSAARCSILNEVASVFNKYSGVVFLSGECADVDSGCRALASQGGFVFAQSAESCVVSGLTDSARESGYVEFNGTPEALMYAVHLRYQNSGQLLC